ncbi:hypothetical protein L204_104810 [Cryptococcus depauperatus]|nr:hypothetical protein L204_05314 [Cryptococcus depauperatus CBS 7855]
MSSPALFAVRLVLQRKAYSTAAVQVTSFLEQESREYAQATLSLPVQAANPHPIPWPTLFKHKNAKIPKPKYCDPLYRRVTSGDYNAALAIYSELTDTDIARKHKVVIQRRHAYLDPALHALRKGDKQSFLLWLDLYPNKPATENRKEGIKSVWEPVVREVYQYRNDLEFVKTFLKATCKLGLLPTTLPPLLSYLTVTLSPVQSREILHELTDLYMKHTTSSTSTSIRAETQRVVAKTQVSQLWGFYLRKLIAVGWESQAEDLYMSPPGGTVWDESTQSFYSDRSGGSHQGLLSVIRSSDLPLPQQLYLATRSFNLPSPNYLARLLAMLSSPPISSTHPTLLSQFKKRFHLPSNDKSKLRELTLVHACIINLVRSRKHHEAVHFFSQHFDWIGLPDHPLKPDAKGIEEDSCIKKYPTIQIITTLLPSLFATLQPPLKESIPAFYKAYITLTTDFSNTYPPKLRPTPITYTTLARILTYFISPSYALKSLRSLTVSSTHHSTHIPNVVSNVGAHVIIDETAYRAILLGFAGRGRLREMYGLLDWMERPPHFDFGFGVNASDLDETEDFDVIFNDQGEPEVNPGTSPETYRSLVAILAKTGLAGEVETVVQRGVNKFGDEWTGRIELN